MTIRSRLIFAACLLLPTLANAMNVPLPDDMCALNGQVPEEAKMINYINSANAGHNQVLAIFAPCAELEAIAQKKATGVSHYGAVLKQELNAQIPMDRATYLSAVATTYKQSSAQLNHAALAESNGAIQNGAKAAQMEMPKSNNAASQGIIYQDPRMVMIAVEKTDNSSGTPVKLASITSLTLIGNAPVSVNYYEPLSEDADFKKSQEVLTRYTNQLIRAN